MHSALPLTYKITKAGLNFLASLLLFLGATSYAVAQEPPLNAYGLKVIKSWRVFKKAVQSNPELAMWPLHNNVPQVRLDLKYTTADNFTKQALYKPTTTTYMRKAAVLALAQVQKTLLQQGLGLKIWDAYRPYAVTEKMWALVPDERLAANPKNGSGHNRGAAVDVTLINIATGEELNMGTGFDHFTDTAHVGFTALPADVLANRRLLQAVMEANGFKVLDTEWWHFYLPNAKHYDLLNLDFKQLKKINQQSCH